MGSEQRSFRGCSQSAEIIARLSMVQFHVCCVLCCFV